MHEKPFYFPGSSGELFGVLHRPKREKNTYGFVLCAPFAEEKLWAHRVYVNFARKLTKMGFPVLRFDYYGHGDSDGDFCDSTVASRITDITCALQILRQEIPDISGLVLVGLRFGATLAAMVAEEDESVSSLILWEPILNGEAYMKSLFRINLTTQTAVFKEVRQNSLAMVEQLQSGKPINIEGYDIGLPLYEQIMAIDLLREEKHFAGNTLVIQIVKKEGLENKKITSFGQMYSTVTIDSVVEKQFWKEIKEYYHSADHLFNSTLNWIENNVRKNSSSF